MFTPETELPIVNADELFDTIVGGVIDGFEVNEDGFHFFLKDGRLLVVVYDEDGDCFELVVGFWKKESLQ